MKVTLLFIAMLSWASAQVIIRPEEYFFPRVDPLKAAVSTAFIGTPNGRWLSVKMPVLPRRIPNFHHDRRIKFRYLWPKPETDRSELVYILSGFGGTASATKPNYLARALAKKGFHSIILPSTFTSEFVLAASEEGVVGELSRDAQDFIRVMKKAAGTIEKIYKKSFKKTHLVGYSYGALTAAFVARIDKREKHFNLEKEILINPPTNLIIAAKTLDSYRENVARMGSYKYLKLLLRVGIPSLYYRRYVPSLGTYESYLEKISVTKEQAQALVGDALSSTLPQVARASAAVTRERIPPVKGLNFTGYFEKVFLPHSRKNHFPEDTLEKVNKRNALYNLREYFESNPNVYLIHNIDDFLLIEGDIDFFTKAFGDRFVLYPWGGHMGNFWHFQNIDGLVSLLTGNPSWL